MLGTQNRARAEHDLEDDEAELLDRSRAGDRQAFADLWRRHAPYAVRYARSLGPPRPDPEDVVGEAFIRIMRTLWAGNGPRNRLRPYLFTTIRNTRNTMLDRMPPTAPIHELDRLPSTVGTVDERRMTDDAAITSAFRSLSERWQQALWLSEVEEMPPRSVADVLGLTANSVAALTYRARGALRSGWIRAQVRDPPSDATHEEIVDTLTAYVGNEMADTARSRVQRHLASCEFCRAVEDALVCLRA